MRPRLTCLCSSRDLCPVHDERDDDETDDERREREAIRAHDGVTETPSERWTAHWEKAAAE